MSAKLVYRFRFLALYWLACFSNTRFTPPFASRVAAAPIPVSLWLGSRVVGLKYRRIPVLTLKNIASEEQFCHLHCYATQGRKHPLPLLRNGSTSACPLTTPTKIHPHKFSKIRKSVKSARNILALRHLVRCLTLVVASISWLILYLGKIPLLFS